MVQDLSAERDWSDREINVQYKQAEIPVKNTNTEEEVSTSWRPQTVFSVSGQHDASNNRTVFDAIMTQVHSFLQVRKDGCQ